MAAGDFRVGMNGTFKWGPAGSQATTEAKNVDDVSYAGKADMAEAKIRGTRRKTRKATYIDDTLTFTVYDLVGDAFVAALVAAANAATPTPIALWPTTAESGQGLDGDYYVSLTRDEGNGDFVTYKVEAQITEEQRPAVWQ